MIPLLQSPQLSARTAPLGHRLESAVDKFDARSWVAGGGAALLLLFELTNFALYQPVRVPLAIGLVLLGVFHGCFDQLIVRHLFGKAGSTFIGSYLLMAGIVAVGLVVLPELTLVLFFVLSAYHFGEEELGEHAALHSGLARFLARTTLGAFVLLAPLALHPHEVVDVLNFFGVGWAPWPIASGAIVAAALLYAALRVVVGTPTLPQRWYWSWLPLVALFVVAEPLVSFAAYFTLRHAVSHVTSVRDKLTSGGGLAPLLRGCRPIALATFVLGGLLFAVAWFVLPSNGLGLLLACLAALTAPHAIVVSLLRRRSRAELPTNGQP